MIVTLLLGSVLAYILWSVFCLELNVRRARALNVPVVRLPIDSNNIPWTILQPHVWNVLDRLPFEWSSYPDFVRYARRGWHFADKSDTHVRLGPVWALVTPVAIYLHFADPKAIQEIFTRRRDFIRPIKEYKLLEVYGPCISTAGWDDWPRHRKVLAAPFSESIMKFVWYESLRQAEGMLRSWAGAPETGVPSMQKDTRTLSLNVLASTGFRKSYEFRGSADPAVDEAGSYRDALQTVLDNVILLMLVPFNVLRAPMMPRSWARIGDAGLLFKEYMSKMLEDETAALSQGLPGSGGIMTSLARSLDVHNRVTATTGAKEGKEAKKGLSKDEIFGNLFVINFAGHDTTANTLAFSFLLLAAHPEVQDWMAQEIRVVTGETRAEDWDYKTVFPRLKRCQAVLLETLRLYPPIMALPKWTSERAQALAVGERTLVIPPGISTVLSLLAVQTHPQYWADPLAWKPSRWIADPAPSGSPDAEQIEMEGLSVPERSIYFPWSDGPQNCPGRKFSEVEAVAVLACLFRGHRVSAKKDEGESDTDARKRVQSCINDVNMEMLLRMRDADRIKLECREASIS